MSDFRAWNAEAYGGLLCVPLLAIGVLAVIDLLGGIIIGLNWLWEHLL